MIFESLPWKMELKRHLETFNTWSKRGDTARGGFYIERGIFLSAFTIRKLMENRKITDSVRDRTIRCQGFRPFRPLSDRVTKFFGIFDPDREYDLRKSETITISCYDLMSEIMHSYVFVPVIDENTSTWSSFFVNSYNRRDDRLLEIQRADFEKVLRDVIDDDVWTIEVAAHPTSGKVIAKVSGGPQHIRRRRP
jgi:hypothetical protein